MKSQRKEQNDNLKVESCTEMEKTEGMGACAVVHNAEADGEASPDASEGDCEMELPEMEVDEAALLQEERSCEIAAAALAISHLQGLLDSLKYDDEAPVLLIADVERFLHMGMQRRGVTFSGNSIQIVVSEVTDIDELQRRALEIATGEARMAFEHCTTGNDWCADYAIRFRNLVDALETATWKAKGMVVGHHAKRCPPTRLGFKGK
jgi:hypothetical protein